MKADDMKALLLSEIFPPQTGGSGRWFFEIYSRLPRESVFVAAGQHDRQSAFDESHNMNVERLNLTMPDWGIRSWSAARDYWRLFRELRSLIARENITEIHCGRCLPEGWLAFLLSKVSGIPYISYVHGEDVESAATSRELSWMTHRVLRNASFLVANSQNTARLLTDNWQLSDDHVRVLHPGVDASRFVPAARDHEVRSQLGWDDRTVILTVGRLQKRKGHDVMVRALQAIRKDVPDVLYVIVGDGEERSHLHRLVRELELGEHVRFLGEIDDRTMIRCYQQCQLFALPNRQVGRDIEGFGMVLVEAQACGRPVLAGASGGTAETMNVGTTGIVIPCEEPERLASEVSALLLDTDRLGQMGSAARPHVVEHLDWNALTRDAATLFGFEAVKS